MATAKLVANEFVAMIELQKIAHQMSPRGLGICKCVFLVSFANFASIGIVAGAIKGLNEQQGNVVSRFGLRLVYGATLVSLPVGRAAGVGAVSFVARRRFACTGLRYNNGGLSRRFH